jgi:hypothetical protein
MVRRFAVLSFLALAGCAGLREAVTAHQDVVARAAGQELTVNRLAELMAPVKSVPLRRDVVDRVAELWVDWQLLGQAVASGDSLLDSATVSAANWPAEAQRIADRLHDTMIVSRARVSPGQVDSAYNVGDVRWLDHILVAVRSDTTDEVKAGKRRLAEGYLAQLRRGADFAKLAAEKSQDPGSARNGGSLGLVFRGQMVKPFEEAAWGLKPGEYSEPVATPYGYHVIWRPRLDQVRDSFTTHLRDAFVQRLDSLYIDSLNRQTAIKVRSSAPSAVRAAAQNLREAKKSSRVLATYTGGELTQRDFARWLQAFPPQTRAMVPGAPDSTLVEFVKSIARNDMLIRTAEARHIRLTAEDRDTIREQYRRDLGSMLERLGVAPESLAADTVSKRSRAAAAGRRADSYFEDVIKSTSQRQFFEVPPFLSDVLRSRFAWDISPVGVDRALEKAKDLRGPAPPSPMTPAPSGPPMSPIPQAGQGQQPAPSRPQRRP